MATVPSLAPAKQRGNLLVWGMVENDRLGMKLPEAMFGASEALRGPVVDSPLHNSAVKGVVQVVCRASKTLALTEDGSVYSWGMCENYSLGHGAKVTRLSTPRKIEALSGIKIVQVNPSSAGPPAFFCPPTSLPNPPHIPPPPCPRRSTRRRPRARPLARRARCSRGAGVAPSSKGLAGSGTGTT